MPDKTPGLLFRDTYLHYLSRLRFPKLFTVTALIFLIDLLIPDAIPFVDEILFGLMTVLLSMLKERKGRKQDTE